MNDFELDPRLAADSHLIADGPLSQLRLMDDARFTWLLLVPRLADACEWIDISAQSQALLLAEINHTGNLLRACGPCDKLNLGALGNIVRQLHVHLLARNRGDAAWPGPVWGVGSAQRRSLESRNQQLQLLRGKLQPEFWRPPAC